MSVNVATAPGLFRFWASAPNAADFNALSTYVLQVMVPPCNPEPFYFAPPRAAVVAAASPKPQTAGFGSTASRDMYIGLTGASNRERRTPEVRTANPGFAHRTLGTVVYCRATRGKSPRVQRSSVLRSLVSGLKVVIPIATGLYRSSYLRI